jgi:hypothetical protein
MMINFNKEPENESDGKITWFGNILTGVIAACIAALLLAGTYRLVAWIVGF